MNSQGNVNSLKSNQNILLQFNQTVKANSKMSKEREQKQGDIKAQTKGYDLKKNRISFKQFQQHYEDHVETQKQKKKTQQQSLGKLAIKNTKPLQNSNKENQLNQMNKAYQVQVNYNSKKQLQQLSLNQLNRLNGSVELKSCFVSPKASSHVFMKSINLASNKSKERLGFNDNKNDSNSNRKNNGKYFDNKKSNLTINLNCGKSVQIGTSKTQKVDNLPNKESNSTQMTKNSSLTQMNRDDLYEGSLTSYGSTKFLREEQNFQSFNINQILNQQINCLTSELQFLNQFFKEIQPEPLSTQSLTGSDFTYKMKLLSQIRSKLTKLSLAQARQENPMKILFMNILQLLQSYEKDLKRFQILNQSKNTTKTKALEIKIDEQVDNECNGRFKRQDSKKKTVKLSKSRRTNEETLHTESIAHPFETSEFSLMNTSKITQVSRPSSVNKQKTKYYNEIEHIINNKILQNSIQNSDHNEQQIPKYQNQNKIKIHIKEATKNFTQQNKIDFNQKSMVNSYEEPAKMVSKNKSVTKMVTLIVPNKTSVSVKKKLNPSEGYPNIPRDKSMFTKISKQIHPQYINQVKNIAMRDILERNKKAKQDEEKRVVNAFEAYSTQNRLRSQSISVPETRNSFASPNDSIFELQYLENYSSQNHHITTLGNQAVNSMKTNPCEAPSSINWKQNTYSSQLFR